MSTEFRRTLPAQPDLDQQKTQAKELLHVYQSGDPDAQARVRAVLPDKQSITLADAQFTLAREYGFGSWAELKLHIEQESAKRRTPEQAAHHAFQQRDARAVRALLTRYPELRARINDPLFSFDAPAIVHFAGDTDAAMVEVLLEFGADPNRRSDWWAGPFHALHNASPAAAKALLDAGAVPDACAAARIDRPDLLEAMIAANPECVHERGGDGQTPLHFARSRTVADLLLDAGADIDARDVDHRSTPAEWMLDRTRGKGRYELAQYLVSRGATADIFLAAALGLNDRVRELLQENPGLLDLRSTQGDYAEKPPSSYHIYMWTIGPDKSPLQVTEQFAHTDTLEVMRSFASPRQQLLSALADGNAAAAHELLRVQPNLLDELTDEDRRVLPAAGWVGNARAVRLMLDLGFDPAIRNESGATVLHCAAWEGSDDSVRIILANPGAAAVVNAREQQFHATPLGWCCHGSCYGPRHRNHAGIARMLLEAGAIPERETGDASEEVRQVIEEWRRRHAAGR